MEEKIGIENENEKENQNENEKENQNENEKENQNENQNENEKENQNENQNENEKEKENQNQNEKENQNQNQIEIEDIEIFEKDENKTTNKKEEEIINFSINQIQEIIHLNNDKNQYGLNKENKIIKSISSFNNILTNNDLDSSEKIISNPKIFIKNQQIELCENIYNNQNNYSNITLKNKLKDYDKFEKTIKNISFSKDIEENEDLRLSIIGNPLSKLFKDELEKVLRFQQECYLKKFKNNSNYKYDFRANINENLGYNNIPHFLFNRVNDFDEGSFEEEIEQENIEDLNNSMSDN